MVISKTEITIFFVFAGFQSVDTIEKENPKSGDGYFIPTLKSFQTQGETLVNLENNLETAKISFAKVFSFKVLNLDHHYRLLTACFILKQSFSFQLILGKHKRFTLQKR